MSERKIERTLCEKCERCHDDGLRDDEECVYYGEPNGCNHPNGGMTHIDGELLGDISKQLREYFSYGSYIYCRKGDEDYSFFEGLADRIDAAHHRSTRNQLDAYCVEVERLQRNWKLEHEARVNDCEKLLKVIKVRNELVDTLKAILSSAASYSGERPDAELAEQIIYGIRRDAHAALKEVQMNKCENCAWRVGGNCTNANAYADIGDCGHNDGCGEWSPKESGVKKCK